MRSEARIPHSALRIPHSFRLTLALLGGRSAAWVSRRLGSGGTVLPGHIIQRMEPRALGRLVQQLPQGVVLVSGTNGKTTTTRMVAHIAAAAGLRPIHNRSGANLMAGILSAVAARADLRGHASGDIGIFEVDEAHVPTAVRALSPRVLALMNVFRDQLDRYGEVDLVAETWRKAVQTLDPRSTLILNADDPTVAELAGVAPCAVLTFGIEDQSVGTATLPHEADRRLCPRCAHRLLYARCYYAHLGHYRCKGCGWGRPPPHLAITRAADPARPPQRLTLDAPGGHLSLDLPLAGLYNAYNALASAAISTAIGIPTGPIQEALRSFTGVFGRHERISVGEGSLLLTLVKNPVGFNQALSVGLGVRDWGLGAAQSPTPSPQPPLVVLAINDRFADGTDVSWLWDVDFELVASRGCSIMCTGLRAHDMALRLKYAMIPADAVGIEPRMARAVDEALRAVRGGRPVSVFATYTAMLAIRREFHRRGLAPPFWED